MKKQSVIKLTILPILICLMSCGGKEEQWVEQYENGKPKLIYIYEVRNRESLVQTGEERLYENGKTRHKGGGNADTRTGVWNFYFENGEKFAQADFTNSQMGEKWRVFDSSGNALVTPKDKVLDLHFAADGGLCDITVRKGDKEIFYKFFESFKINIISHRKGNIPNGETTSWFENGKLNSYYYYKDGIQDSIYKVYTENGSLLCSGQYSKGVKVGKWEYFLSNGTPAGIEIYDIDGTLLKGRGK